jgi:uncharacterized membrane protein YraQ (UPF0718 family)
MLGHLGEEFIHALVMALGMFWQTGWTLVLGFTISAILQSLVSADQMRQALGRDGVREIALATAAGAASSSCSYASAAITRTLFKKGAALVTSLAFLFASTNLVLELGIILFILMGWQFMAAEWIGGLLLVAIMSVLVKLTYPKQLAEDARKHKEQGEGHQHMAMDVKGGSWRDKLANPDARVAIAQNFAMEWMMLWKDLALGFLIGGFLSAFVPDQWWKALFMVDASPWLKVPLNALLGPIIAMLTFVCSIGNVPLAAVLFAGGAGFGGVIAFLYADLIVIPLLDAYRRYFGWRMAAYIGVVFYVTMVIAALIMELLFTAAGWLPGHTADVRQQMSHFSLNYTFWLNLVFGALAIYWFWLNHRHPMHHHGS